MTPPAYCPFCGGDAILVEVETHTLANIFRCQKRECPGYNIDIKTDMQGFIEYPKRFIGYYIYTRKRDK
jgi:hypothetical protein